ncbi:S24 family peptidase [Armatimonas sp.]|uniref:S24 family peptidase n=1 Tax=Armatimonas sp. TaxID=1872638 RepID=UPI00375283C6
MKIEHPTCHAKHTYLKALTLGQGVKGVYALRAVSQSSNERAPLTLTLSDGSGTCKAALFGAGPDLTQALHSAVIVQVEGIVNATGNYKGDINLSRVEVLDPAEWTSDELLPPLPADHRALCQRFTRLMESIADPHLRLLQERVFTPEFRAQFEVATAAKVMHHAERGGLLRHSLEVALICDRICDILPALDRDLLVAAALLHDVGKIREMRHDLRAGDYTEFGILIGHITGGMALVLAKAAELPLSLRHHLGHLILSHHERPEYGAAKEPMTPEAVVLAHADAVSAHATAGLEARAESYPGQIEQRRHGRLWCVTAPRDFSPRPSPYDLVPSLRITLPVLGAVAAGIGESAEGDPDEYLDVVPPPKGADFLARVTGDSMIGDGIFDGDLVFVQIITDANLGDLVVAHIPGSGNVVKRFQGDRLESSNPNYPPIPLDETVHLQGRVTRVQREL